jgi:hypothetical protein
MPDVVGEIIVASVVATGEGEGFAAAAEATYLGVSGITIIGSVALLGASIGLQYALSSNPQLPKPQDGAQALRQAIPPRQRGYGTNRLAGYYMFYEAEDIGGPPATSYDVVAFHSGKVESLLGIYLSDDAVSTTPSVLAGGAGNCNALGDGSYGPASGGSSTVIIQIRLGDASQSALSSFSGSWGSTHVGNGIAYAGVICGGLPDPTEHTRIYPRGRPELSVLAVCSPIWDPRDGAQSLANPATWIAKSNPVLELLDYVIRADGGMGQDIDIALPPATLAQWMVEADLCDGLIGGLPRYDAHGWFRYDSSPEEVINSILSACDGWISESGDGTLSLVVGYYREPTDPPITASDIVGFSLNCGQADEEIVNVLNVSFTDPSQKYVETQLDDVRDEVSISETGVARPRPLSLTWVQSAAQAERLAARAMSRLNPKRSGTLTTKLIGLRYLGKRWVKLQYPFVAALEDCVIEIQPSPKIDLLGGHVTFTWNLVDPAALLALQ